MTDKKQSDESGTDKTEPTGIEKMKHGAAVVSDLAKIYAHGQGTGKALASVYAHTEQLDREQLRFALSAATAAVTEFRKELMTTMFAAIGDGPTLN
jgi:hypothetical protein